jgi:UDP-N-acetylmuramate--alanine ligase
VSLEDIGKALGSYTGVRRRFDVLERGPVTVVDDYAHHPTEVGALVESARSAYPDRRIVGVFQPHQHSRLRLLLGRFAEVLERFDEILVTNVFHSRDGDDAVRAIDSRALVDAIHQNGKACHDTPSFDDVVVELDSLAQPGDIVIFMGAGTVTQLARRYADHVSPVGETPGGRVAHA